MKCVHYVCLQHEAFCEVLIRLINMIFVDSPKFLVEKNEERAYENWERVNDIILTRP